MRTNTHQLEVISSTETSPRGAVSYQDSRPGQYSMSRQPAHASVHRGRQEMESEDNEECCCCGQSHAFNRLEDETDSVTHRNDDSCCLTICLTFCCCIQEEFSRMQQVVNEQKQRIVDLDNEGKQYKDKIERLNQTVAEKSAKNQELTMRVSKLASERMREGNACVEDLSDTLRPSAIAEKWSGFFRSGEYWTTFENIVQSGKSEAATAELLYRVCKIAFKTCVDMIEELVPTVVTSQPRSGQGSSGTTTPQSPAVDIPELRRKLEALLPDNTSDVEAFLQPLSDNVATVQRKLRRSVVEFLRTWRQPPLVQQWVMQVIEKEVEGDIDVALIGNFTAELTLLCYAMRLHEIPMAVKFDSDAGSTLDTTLYEVEGSRDQGSEARVVRPPLLREDRGAVLLKGELQFMKPVSPQPGADLARANPARHSNRGQREQFADGEKSGAS